MLFRSGADQAAEDNVGNISTTISTSSANRPTIGQTSVSTTEQAQIREEVRSELRKLFPGIRHSALQQPETVEQKFPELAQPLEPIAIAGSEVSVANTQPGNEAVGEQSAFSRMMQNAGAGPSAPFPNVMWRPKEPPCYFGRTGEDVHTWTSLVRCYLSFMGGSDAQQVTYAVTLLRDHAHEWFSAYERRNRNLPRDWAQLSAALLERFGSNTRSQEAQSQLMAISQGQRPVREYSSQFETLLGRLESYDEGMMLNQFVWGLQPELARSVALHYPKSIAQAVSLAETTELATKASRRPAVRGQTGRPQGNTNPGRGQYRNRGMNRFRGQSSMASNTRRPSGGGRRGGGRDRKSVV